MKLFPSLSLPVLLLGISLIVPSPAHAQTAAPAKPVAAPLEPADQPFPKMQRSKEGVTSTTTVDAGFLAAHKSFLERGKSPIGILFLGDSITAGWKKAPKVWDEHYGKDQPANFGIGGDKTQHVLWRIAQGELDGIHPKVLVLMIGTNNIGYPTEDIIKGDLKIMEEIHRKLPETKVLLLGIFPRAPDAKSPMRAKIKTVNEALAKLDDGKTTRYLDIGAKFLDADGNLPKDIMPDSLHPNEAGYKIWADATQPLLDQMLK